MPHHISNVLVDREEHYLPGQLREALFQNVCNGNIKGKGRQIPLESKGKSDQKRKPKCHFIHHSIPFLIIGPFQMEVKFYFPFRTIIHDFFAEKELDWLMEYSRPRLTLSREGSINQASLGMTKSALRYMNLSTKGFTVAKAVTLWFNDIEYTHKETWSRISKEGQPLEYKVTPTEKDPDNYIIYHKLLNDISRRIELVTYLNVTARYGASPYQTTNYGISGMVRPHMDPLGYEKGVELTEDHAVLVKTGDYIATFMGWFSDTQAGGETAFLAKQYEGILQPTKGSAAFWINLASCHTKDDRAEHAGCPVLKGSKWILNKWIYSWEQWKSWPCYLEPLMTIFPFNKISP